MVTVKCRRLRNDGCLVLYFEVTGTEREEALLQRQLRDALNATKRAAAKLSYAIENINQSVVVYDEEWRAPAYNQNWA